MEQEAFGEQDGKIVFTKRRILLSLYLLHIRYLP